jgi:hypothetical protein
VKGDGYDLKTKNKLDGKPIENGRQLQVRLYRHVIGDTVSIIFSAKARP